MYSAPGLASSEPHPSRNAANALRLPKRRRAISVTGRHSRRGGAANRTTRTAERDIQGIGGPHTGLGRLTGPQGRCTVALNPRNESRIPHCRKPEKHCNTKWLSRGGWGGIRTHETLSRLPVFKCGCGRPCKALVVLFSPSFLAYPAYFRARHTGWCRAVISSSLANRLAKGRVAQTIDALSRWADTDGKNPKEDPPRLEGAHA